MLATSLDLSPLFEPLTVGAVTLRNRFVMPGMQTRSAPGGTPAAETASYFRARAEGGCAMIISGSAAIDHPSATWQKDIALLVPQTRDGWSRCAEAVREVGGVFLAQLFHEGAIRKEGQGGPCPDAPSLSPSGLYMAGKPNGRAASASDLEEIRDAYVRSAALAVAAGADGIELHCAHGYLLDQFMWAQTNRREDGYGGDRMSDRVRFPAEIVAAIRSEIGADAVISVRFSQWKEVDFTARIFDGPGDLQVFVDAFEVAGANLLHASTRRFNQPEWAGSDLGLAGWTRGMTKLPVITVGSVGLRTDVTQSLFGEGEDLPDLVDNLDELVARFADRQFDLVSVGRSNLADPQWVEKVRTGRFEDIRSFRKSDLARILQEEWDPGFIGEDHNVGS